MNPYCMIKVAKRVANEFAPYSSSLVETKYFSNQIKSYK